jgi:hypothetical protein
MRKFLVLFVCLLSFSAMAGDTLPWPWSCPFPWSQIAGEWVTSETSAAPKGAPVNKSYFEFRLIGEFEDGTRILEVKHYGGSHELLAWGRGVASSDQRLVRAALHKVDGEVGEGYWVLVRSAAAKEAVCSHSELARERVTEVTVRPFDACLHPDGCGFADEAFLIQKTVAVSLGKEAH